ncbi:MAG: replication protein [Deltaproteobacteria bacterium]|nr:replication protein [Deltaproteobacteria bacterium]
MIGDQQRPTVSKNPWSPNTTWIPTLLHEKLYETNFTVYELRFLLYLSRETHGCGRSVSALNLRHVAEQANIHKNSLYRVINKLIEDTIIFRKDIDADEQIYGFVKDTSQWQRKTYDD